MGLNRIHPWMLALPFGVRGLGVSLCISLDIQFNADKSYLFVVGQSYGKVLPALSINGAPIVWANSLRYLGVKFVSDKRLNIDISQVCLLYTSPSPRDS